MANEFLTTAALLPDCLNWGELTIANGSDTSDELDLRGFALVGLLTPAALTATATELEVSRDGVRWVPVYDREGAALTAALAPDRHVVLPPADLPGFRKVRLKLNSAEAAARTVGILVRKLG